MTAIHAKAIEKSENYVEFILYDHGNYSRPLAIVNDYEILRITDCAVENLPTRRLVDLLEQIELELMRRKSTPNTKEPKAQQEN